MFRYMDHLTLLFLIPQHNPFKLPLTAKGIFLKRKRPLFFCERRLLESDAAEDGVQGGHSDQVGVKQNLMWQLGCLVGGKFRQGNEFITDLSLSRNRDSSVRPRIHRRRSASALLGSFRNFEDRAESEIEITQDDSADTAKELSVDVVVQGAIEERKWSDRPRKLFEAFALDDDGFLGEEEFIHGSPRLQAGLTDDELRTLFKIADIDDSGTLDYKEFLKMLRSSDWGAGIKLPASHRDDRGLIQIEPSREKYFGQLLRRHNAGKSGKTLDFTVARSQDQAMQLYETRIASMQRFVSMAVMFHQMGKRVENFFENISFGLLGYRMDRTHSIMRIATTASPVSGADVRQRMLQLQLLKKVQHSIHVISTAYLHYKGVKGKADSFSQEVSSTGKRPNKR
jgi:hypothetical protein